MQSHRNPTTYMSMHHQEGTHKSKLPSEERSAHTPHIRHPNSYNLHLEEEPPKYLALKTNRAWVYETQTAAAN